MTTRITIEKISCAFFVFDVEDAAKLRTHHRILGKYIGCLPLSSFQNDYLGLPLKLSFEECFYLFSKGFCRIIERILNEDVDKECKKNDEKLAKYLEERNMQRQAQSELIHKDLIEERLSKVDLIAAGRLAKLAKKRRLINNTAATDGECSHGGDEKRLKAADLRVSTREREDFTNSVTKQEKMTVETEIKSSPLTIIDDDHVLVELPLMSLLDDEENFQEIQLNQPDDQRGLLKYAVFKDLHDRGYYLTGGFKFGGDFLVYPGDPFLYHANFIALIVVNKGEILDLDKFAYCRIGCLVKKIFLLCYWNEDRSRVVYESLTWRKNDSSKM